MLQAPAPDGLPFDPFSFQPDALSAGSSVSVTSSVLIVVQTQALAAAPSRGRARAVSWMRRQAAATFHLLHLAISAKGDYHLNEAVVVKAALAEKAANPVHHPVTAFRHGPNF